LKVIKAIIIIIIFRVLPKKVETFARRSNINFPEQAFVKMPHIVSYFVMPIFLFLFFGFRV